MSPKEFNVSLTGGAPYGMRIKGGSEFTLPISIENVSANSKADCVGIRPGDVVLSINGTDVSKASHDRAKELIIQAKDVLTLTIVRHNQEDFPQVTTITRSAQEVKTEAKPSQASAQPTPVTTSATPISQPTPVKTESGLGRTNSNVRVPYTAPRQTPNIENKSTYQQPSASNSNATSSIVQKEPAKPTGGPQTVGNFVTSRDNVKYEPYRPDDDKPTGNIKHVNIANMSSGICQKCNQSIGNENHVKLGDKIWHTNHFTCSVCDKNIASEGFFEEGDKAICKNCFEDIFAQKCSKCSKSLTGQYVTASGQSYHKECFVCERCRKSLSGQSFNHHEEKPYCIDCLSDMLSIKCDNCNKPIRPNDSYIGALSKSFHVGCLLCSICGADLSNTGKFQVKDNKPCCPHHV